MSILLQKFIRDTLASHQHSLKAYTEGVARLQHDLGPMQREVGALKSIQVSPLPAINRVISWPTRWMTREATY